MTDKQAYLSAKIKKLREEGYSPAQSAAISYSMYERQNKAQQGTYVAPLPMRTAEQEAQMENYRLLRASALRGSGVRSEYKPTPLLTEDDRLKDLERYKDLRASILPGYKVNTGYTPNLVNPEQAGIDYSAYRNNTYIAPPITDNNMQQGGFKSPYGQLPSDVGYDFNYPQLTTPYEYQNPNYQPPTTNISNNGFQYNLSAIPSGVPSDVLNQEVNPLNAQPNSGQQVQTQYNDVTRYNVPQLYGGVDLESALAYAGQGFGEGKYGQAALGTGLSVLKGARNFLTGYSSGKESDRVKKEQYDDLFNPKINYAYAQQGTKVTNSEILTGKYAVDEGKGNYNLENGEFLKRAKTGNVQEVMGEPHIKGGKEADGVDVTLEDGDKVLSDYTKIPAKNVKELKERYNLSLRKNATFADAQKAFDKKLGIQKETDALSDLIEKFGKNSTVDDETTKRLNDLTLSKQIETGKKKLDLLGAPQSMMFEDLFQMQESLPKKGNPGELLDKNGKVIEGTENVAQQGGELSDLASKYGITLERAHELLTMQLGGEANEQTQEPPQQETSQEQQTEQPTQEQVMQFVAQALQGGADPNQIIEQLIQNGIPHEAAMQIVGQVSQQMQGGQDQQMEAQAVEEGLPIAQQGLSFATKYTPTLAGYNVTPNPILNQDILSGVEPTQHYSPERGYGEKMTDVEKTISLHDWYFNTPEKKEAFRIASKKKGEQPEIKAFQQAYNLELLKRAESAGVPKEEVNKIISEVGFTGENARQEDGLFGAFTSSRPLYSFAKQDGEVKATVTPIEAVPVSTTEQRNITKQVIPWLPQDLRLAPSSIDPLHKEQINLGRAEAVKLTPEPQLAEAERLRQSDVARVQASGLSPAQQEALLSQGLASSQMAANNAIAQTEQANQANLAQTEQFNIGQAAKEQITNANFNQVYQNQVLGGLNAYERDWRSFYNEANAQNKQNYKDIESVNILNAQNENYQYLPGAGIQYINTPSTNLALPSLPTDIYKGMTPEQIEEYKRQQIIKARAEGMKSYTTNIKTV